MEVLTLEQSTVNPHVQVVILLYCSTENSIAHSPMSRFIFHNGCTNIVTEYCESTRSSCCYTASTKSHCLVRNALFGPFFLRELSQQTGTGIWICRSTGCTTSPNAPNLLVHEVWSTSTPHCGSLRFPSGDADRGISLKKLAKCPRVEMNHYLV